MKDHNWKASTSPNPVIFILKLFYLSSLLETTFALLSQQVMSGLYFSDLNNDRTVITAAKYLRCLFYTMYVEYGV
jgi:hypothetical protein